MPIFKLKNKLHGAGEMAYPLRALVLPEDPYGSSKLSVTPVLGNPTPSYRHT